MSRLWAAAAALFALFLLAAPARASGDFTCMPVWTLTHTQFTGCDSMALLGPGNDTRVNLHLLLLDRRPDPAEAAATGGAAPFSWADFEDTLAGHPDTAHDETSEDVAPQTSEFAAGEGTRCVSNARGASGFEAALAAAPHLPPDERAQLSDARKSLQPTCGGDGGLSAPGIAEAIKSLKSPAARAFGAYLLGAAAFYDGDFVTAHTQFAGLFHADGDWLRQSARYMLARVEINRAQVNAFDEYGALTDPPKVDAAALAAADTGLHGYLHDYPAGLYAASARGLLRRVYWLGGQKDKLAAEYAWQLAQTDPHARNLSDGDLAQEIDAKLLDKADAAHITDPALLAVVDLRDMRRGDTDNAGPPPLTLAALEAQRPRFAADPALFDYLLAAHAWFIDGRPADVVRLIAAGSPSAPLTYLQFSRQLLRALALDKLGDPTARAAISQLLSVANRPYQRGAMELAMAMHDERHGDVRRVFEATSPVQDADIRAILLRHAAGPDLLRQRVAASGADNPESRLALYVLLYKELTRGDYAAFVDDLKRLPPDLPKSDDNVGGAAAGPDLAAFKWSNPKGPIPCPGLAETAGRLVREPRAVGPRLCIGEFTRLSGLDHSELDTPPAAGELGGAPSQFPGGSFSRMAIYQSVIADTAATADARAYALYRAIYCYAPSGNNDCGGPDLPVAQRKAWFRMLKSQYAASPWAADTSVYW